MLGLHLWRSAKFVITTSVAEYVDRPIAMYLGKSFFFYSYRINPRLTGLTTNLPVGPLTYCGTVGKRSRIKGF